MALTRVGGDLLKRPLNIGTGVTITVDGNATFSGIVTAANFVDANGNPIGGASVGLGTVIIENSTVGGEQIYYTDTTLTVTGDLTVNPPDSSNIAYTQYSEIAVEQGYDLIVEDGDDLIPDILGLSSTTAGVLPGAGGRVRADQFTNKAGTGAPSFPNGISIGSTASLSSDLTVTGNLTVSGSKTYLNTDSVEFKDKNIGISSATNLLTDNQLNGAGFTIYGLNSNKSLTWDNLNDRMAFSTNLYAPNITADVSITVGDTFLKPQSVGLGQTTTAGRNAGIGTAIGTIIYNTQTFQAEIYKGADTGWQNISHTLTQATGGQVSDYTVGSTVYRAHIFNSSGTFDVTNVGPGTVDLLLIAGGGGGGGSWTASNIGQGGGGGAGGLFYRSDVPINQGANAVVIGAGGVGDGNQEGGNAGTDGGDSTALGITADGGGVGGSYGTPGYAGGTGGSGGGAGYARAIGPATGATIPGVGVDLISPPAGWGRDGGDYSNTSPAYAAGGGGGAAYAGTSGSGTAGGPGGDGLQYSIVGFTTYYAGGGGGGSDSATGVAGSGGLGGGGAGSADTTRATDAIVNTGGGGGGGGNGPGQSVGQGAAGGSGIAVIRYQIADLTAAAKATGGYISYANGKTIHKFEKTGVFTITDSSLTSVDALVIGGGGAGGNGAPSSHYGGGGGAGALHYQTNLPVSNASPYAVSIGAGGVATWYQNSNGTSGTQTVFSTITAAGGGAGRATGPGAAFNGGSGGGAAFPGGAGGTGSGDTGGTANSVSPSNGWGNDGAAYGTGGYGGAGGGAGGIGGVSLSENTDGGLGLSYNISGSSVTYATGGAGSNAAPGGKGESYTGNGGNGGRLGYAHPERNSNGGSGIVIISYPS